MRDEQEIRFGPFRFDPTELHLWKGEQVVAVQPKPLAVLRALVVRSGQVVTKKELLKEVWAGTYVTQAVLKVAVRALREALGESAEAPQYLETIGREGYRFLGAVVSDQLSVVSSPSTPPGSQLATENRQLTTPFVGRDTELQQLQIWFGKALNGARQVVFVTGEPGIGKTALIDAFVSEVLSPRSGIQQQEESQKSKVKNQKSKIETAPRSLTPVPHIGRGQCVEHYGEGEAYLPVLEALEQLAEGPGGARLREVLRQYAPTWLVQMPALVSDTERKGLQATVHGATRERMLRELADALERLSSIHPLVLILEDLHWSDHSTIELLSHLAQRRLPARFLVLGTYRPTDLVLGQHPLKGVKQELQAHRQCEEERLELLSEQNVTEYLARRFPRHQFPPQLATEIHQRTDGNALFMVNVVEELVNQARVVQDAGIWRLKENLTSLNAPDSVRQLIERQMERLRAEEQQVLEVASVAGNEFSVAAIAAALKQEMDVIEDVCEGLAWQGLFLTERGLAEWPDGTISGRYAFRHALYQNVLYERIAEARRVRLHRLIGERTERGYGEQAGEIAAELAVHFERGHDIQRAIQYRQHAGQNAIRRSAHQEAIGHLTKGLALLQTLPDTPERIHQELTLQLALGAPLLSTKGYADPEVERTYKRALELCQQMGETPQLFPALYGLFAFYNTRAELQTARELGEQSLHLAQSLQDPAFLLQAHYALGITLYFLGELASARAHLEQGIALYDSQQHRSHAFLYGTDSGVGNLSYVTLVLWYLGYPDQALQRSQEALALAQKLSHPFSLAIALNWAATLHQLRREGQVAQERAEAAIAVSTEQGFPFWLAQGTILRGWALAEQGQKEEGIAQLRQGLAALRATGAEVTVPYGLVLLAEAYGEVGQVEEGLRMLAEALAVVDKTSERYYEAELYRLKGELTLQQESQKSKSKSQKSKVPKPKSQRLTPNSHAEVEAEEYFLKAIEIARQQQAKSLELRAATSLARLWQQQGKKKQVHETLAKIYNWFTEGFDTKDLQEAKVLIEEVSD